MLPNDPSELIRLAIADLEKVEHDERYSVNMNAWHEPIEEVCCVCLAGALMAGTLNGDPGSCLDPRDFDGPTRAKLWALNSLGRGNVLAAFTGLGLGLVYERGRRPYSFLICRYRDDPDSFKRDMLELASRLETYLATK